MDKPESISAVKKQVEELTGGQLDILANNAGGNSTVSALDVDFDEVRSTFEVNVFCRNVNVPGVYTAFNRG